MAWYDADPIVESKSTPKSNFWEADEIVTKSQKEDFAESAKKDLVAGMTRQGIINADKAQGGLRGTLQTIGNAAETANDIVGRGIGQVAGAAYENLTTPGFKQRQQVGLETLANTPEGQYVKGLAGQYQQNQEAFNRENPALGRDLSAVREIGTFAMPGGTGSIIKGAGKLGLKAIEAPLMIGKKVGQGAVEIGKDVAGVEKAIPIPTIREMGDLSTNLYKQSAAEGGVAANLGNKFIQEANTVKPLTEKGAAIRGKNPIQDVLDSINTYKDKSFTMAEIDDVDKELTRKINNFLDGGRATPESRDVQQIQNKFRELIDKEDVEGVPSWKEAKNAFATKKRLEDIQDIYDNAKNRPNEATAIQAGFRRIAEDESRMRGYSPEARKFITDAARNSNTVDALKLMGSRLLPLIVGGGGNVGAAAMTAAGGMATRDMAAKIMARKGGKVEQQIMRDFAAKNIGKMPPKEALRKLKEIKE